MAQWEVLSSQARLADRLLMLSINRNGRLTFNAPLFKALGEPEFIRLLYDSESDRLGVVKSAPAIDAYPVKKSKTQETYGVSAFGPLKAIERAPEKAFRAQAKDVGDGVWAISLEGLEPRADTD